MSVLLVIPIISEAITVWCCVGLWRSRARLEQSCLDLDSDPAHRLPAVLRWFIGTEYAGALRFSGWTTGAPTNLAPAFETTTEWMRLKG
jgi:hypothetical protein